MLSARRFICRSETIEKKLNGLSRTYGILHGFAANSNLFKIVFRVIDNLNP